MKITNYVGSAEQIAEKYKVHSGGLDIANLRRNANGSQPLNVGGVDVSISQQAKDLNKALLAGLTKDQQE